MDRKNDGLRLMDGAGYKKIIIACDSYKGCLSSREVNEAIASGLKEWNADDASPEIKKLSPDAASEMKKLDSDDASPEIITLEMSDGGEGMLDAFLSAMKGERVKIHAHDALMRWIEAEYGIVDDTAIIEIAQTAGLALIEPEQRNPMKATSWGVGEMIMNAYRRGVRRFIVGLGGSATSDCGIGMLKAMGDDWKNIRRECSFVLASDVTNPLCGENGAAHVFAPQKGADAKMVQMLDDRARKFAEVSAKHFGYDRSEAPGAGAAGGLGYAFLQYFNAEARPGAELLLEKIEVDALIQDADLVITEIADYIDLGGGKHMTASQFLQFFLFTPEEQHNYVYKLSGGEKRKLYLCTVLMRNPNFLVLDEPTNDLDIQTLQVLEEYLQDFAGCVIVVSHDRYFMDKVVDHLLVFKGEGEIQDFPGNYTQYREWSRMQAKDEAEQAKPAKGGNAPAESDGAGTAKRDANFENKRKMSYKEKREYEQLTQEIDALTEEQKKLEEELCSGNLSVEELTEKSKRLPEIKDELDEKEMRWLELAEML